MKKPTRQQVEKVVQIIAGACFVLAIILNLKQGNWIAAMWAWNATLWFALCLRKDKLIDMQHELIVDIMKIANEQNEWLKKEEEVKRTETTTV